MHQVDFEETPPRFTYQGSPTPWLVKTTMRLSGGLIQSEKAAGFVLSLAAIAVIVASSILLFRSRASYDQSDFVHNRSRSVQGTD